MSAVRPPVSPAELDTDPIEGIGSDAIATSDRTTAVVLMLASPGGRILV